MASKMLDRLVNKPCNCCQGLTPVQEFVGPVKIVLMDVPPNMCTRKAWISALIGLAHMLIAITSMTVLFYTLGFKTPFAMNAHVMLCTIGFQLFMPSAILMMSNLHGPASIFNHRDRKFQHLFLQIFGIVGSALGSVLVMFFSPGSISSKFTLHSITGLVACGLCGASALTGPGAYFASDNVTLGKVAKRTHALCGVPAFVASSLCFMIGIFKSETFNAWAFIPDVVYILMIFCILYTIFIIITPCMKCVENTP